MITLSNQRPEHFQRFEDRAVSMPEVLDCHRISGESDYMVKFLCRDTNVFYESVNRLVKEDQNIRSYWTIIALKRITLSSEEFPIYMLRGQFAAIRLRLTPPSVALSLVKTSSANVVVRLPTRHGTTVVRVWLQQFPLIFMNCPSSKSNPPCAPLFGAADLSPVRAAS